MCVVRKECGRWDASDVVVMTEGGGVKGEESTGVPEGQCECRPGLSLRDAGAALGGAGALKGVCLRGRCPPASLVRFVLPISLQDDSKLENHQ